MKPFILCFVLYFVTACGSGGGGSAASSQTTAPNLTAPSVPAAPPATVSLTYYSVTKTVAPIGSWPAKTYTATGSCVIYNAKTYCWDDGTKTVTIPGVGSYTYSYWDQSMVGAALVSCSGGCGADPLTAPTVLSVVVETNLTLTAVNSVFSSGTSKAVTCTLTGTDLDCVDFVIDIDQAPI